MTMPLQKTPPPGNRIGAMAAAASLILLTAAATSAPAQTPPPGPAALKPPTTALAGQSSPAAKATPASRSIKVVPARPGSYSVWTEGKAGSTEGAVMSLAAGEKSLAVPLTDAVTKLYVFDDATGTVAEYPAAKLKDSATVSVSPADFKKVRTVAVKVTASGGKPVEKASVSFTDASGTKSQKVLTSLDNGTARFENVAMGKATVSAQYGADGPKATQEVTIAPAKGGAPVDIAVALSGSVPTLELVPVTAINGVPTPTTAAPAPAAKGSENEGSNNFLPGIIGLALLGMAAYFGLRHARNRGMTVAGSLKNIGVEMPQDAPGTATGHLKPSAPPPPPLPSLSDLPAAGAAPAAAAAAAVAHSSAMAATGKPRLVGVGGSVSGEVFSLEAGAFTVGRDDGNTLALTQDTTISRQHARIEAQGGGWAVADAGSSNGTYVNGAKVAGSQPLMPGDEIQIGSVRFRYEE